MLNISVDMDGVIVDIVSSLARELGFRYEDVTAYNFSTVPGDVAPKVFERIASPGFFRDLDPYPKAIDFVKRLMGHPGIMRPWFISVPAKSNPGSYMDKISWIARYVPDMIGSTVLLQDKSITNVDAIVDDYPPNLAASSAGLKILFAQPWNQNCTDYVRTDDYDEIYEMIHERARMADGWLNP